VRDITTMQQILKEREREMTVAEAGSVSILSPQYIFRSLSHSRDAVARKMARSTSTKILLPRRASRYNIEYTIDFRRNPPDVVRSHGSLSSRKRACRANEQIKRLNPHPACLSIGSLRESHRNDRSTA